MSVTYDNTRFAPDDMAQCLKENYTNWYSFWNDSGELQGDLKQWGVDGTYAYCDSPHCNSNLLYFNAHPGSKLISAGCLTQQITCNALKQADITACDNYTASCGSFPCQNGGYCVSIQGHLSGKCICPNGWTGKSCETRTCNPACKNGTCTNGQCHCDPGYGGAACDKPMHCPPGSVPYDGACNPNSYCCKGMPQTSNSCGPGKKDLCSVAGVLCDSSNPYAQCGVLPCNPPCKNGTCWRGQCHCDPGYGGVTCDTQVYCNVGMTPYDGACYPNSYCCAGTPGTDDSYKCGPGKKDLCSVAGVMCDSSNPYAQCGIPACNPPCKNGTCWRGQCRCPANCSGHGTCNNTTGVCTCDTGYTGVDCGTTIVNPTLKQFHYGEIHCNYTSSYGDAECVYYSKHAPGCVVPNFGAYCKSNGYCRFEPVSNFPGYDDSACKPMVFPYQAPPSSPPVASKGSPAYVLIHSGHKGLAQHHDRRHHHHHTHHHAAHHHHQSRPHPSMAAFSHAMTALQ